MIPPHTRWPIALSILAAVVTIGMKSAAYAVTGSVGLFSDALESGINLLAALTAAFALWYSSRPADPNHTYGHEKFAFFSSGLEGLLVVLAGLGTAAYAVQRLLFPRELASLELGTALALGASVVNFVAARALLAAGRKHHSIILEADGQHLMTDVWTSVAVVAGIFLVMLTGMTWLDPVLALVIGLHIIHTGWGLVRRSFNGLMDHALPPEEQEQIRAVIRANLPPGAQFHGLRTRRAGERRFIEFHLLVDGNLRVRAAHDLTNAVEAALAAAIPGLEVTTHIEPVDEEGSWEQDYLRQIGEPAEPTRDR